MKRYLKLVNFEFNRFFKLYLVLIGITFVAQMSGVIVESKSYHNQANEIMQEDLLTQSEYVQQYGPMSFLNISESIWFLGTIALCAVTLIIYVFFIWYRDWVGKNNFSYRLFMLPSVRLNIYLAKATTILLFVLGLIALQLLLLPFENQVFKWIVPEVFRTDLSVLEITNLYYLNLLIPKNILEFILFYGAGMTAVMIVFTAILFERSYRLKGIFYGIVYCGVSILIFLAPLLLQASLLENYFYPMELLFLEIAACVLVLAGAIWIGNMLIKNKVRV
ncbi:hypothetical protein EKG37_07240 [Robertmurraya yapensis]|uniref:Uncharacterized protein n=2 Tax=Bacillaceae TaxID=186817 RepID=A0A3S0KMW0_9BACI|nr:hypothetical protein [Bacillus yapensis]RTR33999.1 hypothetical protein EKG37_07240 [Bacillus yapensis]TKS97317.1 hypothetical protein FAR12_07240 [Bacillus yapensis]